MTVRDARSYRGSYGGQGRSGGTTTTQSSEGMYPKPSASTAFNPKPRTSTGALYPMKRSTIQHAFDLMRMTSPRQQPAASRGIRPMKDGGSAGARRVTTLSFATQSSPVQEPSDPSAPSERMASPCSSEEQTYVTTSMYYGRGLSGAAQPQPEPTLKRRMSGAKVDEIADDQSWLPPGVRDDQSWAPSLGTRVHDAYVELDPAPRRDRDGERARKEKKRRESDLERQRGGRRDTGERRKDRRDAGERRDEYGRREDRERRDENGRREDRERRDGRREDRERKDGRRADAAVYAPTEDPGDRMAWNLPARARERFKQGWSPVADDNPARSRFFTATDYSRGKEPDGGNEGLLSWCFSYCPCPCPCAPGSREIVHLRGGNDSGKSRRRKHSRRSNGSRDTFYDERKLSGYSDRSPFSLDAVGDGFHITPSPFLTAQSR